MKKLCLVLILLCAMKAHAQVQFISFDRSICPQAMTNTYTYTNFSSGGGSGTQYGFSVYRNGVSVYTTSGSMGNGQTCNDLIFVNDTIGFLVYYSGNTGTRVLRTEDFGVNWTDIGGGAPNYFGLYIINTHFAYLVTYWNSPQQLYVARCSNYSWWVSSTLIYDQSIAADVYQNDTIIGDDLCGIDSLKFTVSNLTGDTITYHINYLTLVTATSSNQLPSVAENVVFPNPCNDFFMLRNSSVTLQSLRLLSMTGAIVKNFEGPLLANNQFSLNGIAEGIYLLQLQDAGNFTYSKLIISKN